MNYYNVIFKTAEDKAFPLRFDQTYVLYWDENGKAILISTVQDNIWMSVPKLDNEHKSFSMVYS